MFTGSSHGLGGVGLACSLLGRERTETVVRCRCKLQPKCFPSKANQKLVTQCNNKRPIRDTGYTNRELFYTNPTVGLSGSGL